MELLSDLEWLRGTKAVEAAMAWGKQFGDSGTGLGCRFDTLQTTLGAYKVKPSVALAQSVREQLDELRRKARTHPGSKLAKDLLAILAES